METKKSRVKSIFLLIPLLFLCGKITASEKRDSISLSMMEETWREFRAIHPFNFQTVGRKLYGDTCVLVMSEPAEWVDKDKLANVFSKYKGKLCVKHHPFGIDGFFTDAVGCVNLDTTQYIHFEKDLFTLLYHTDYSPIYTDLNQPIDHVYFTNVSLNRSYSGESLNSYKIPVKVQYFKFDERLLPTHLKYLYDSYDYSLYNSIPNIWLYRDFFIKDLCEFSIQHTNEIFYDRYKATPEGLVVWLIDKMIDFQNDTSFLINARRFAIDSDLIIGTYKGKHKIAIIGRERKVPVNILPPLRAETIRLLATCNDGLTLIFNSDSCLAINDSTYTTPIKMSNVLSNTALGNLMILTDIYLKSWSENEEIHDLLINSPHPKTYPFPYGVAHELGETTKYLWNFASVNAGFPGFQPLVKTGSLPPTYWSANDSLFMEQNAINNIAYEYFASLNCPDLVRMNMYAALYRIFRGFGIKQEANKNKSWVQTPSCVISNAKFGNGGFGIGALKNVSKGISRALESSSRLNYFRIRPSVYLDHSGYLFKEAIYPPISPDLKIIKDNTRFFRKIDYSSLPEKELRKINEALIQHNLALEEMRKITSDKKELYRIEDLELQNNLLIKEIIFQRDIKNGEYNYGIIKNINTDDENNIESKKNIPIDHQINTGSHILTDEEIKEKIILKQKNEKRRLEMIDQLKKYGIPMKAILDEWGNTVYIIICEEKVYEYAA